MPDQNPYSTTMHTAIRRGVPLVLNGLDDDQAVAAIAAAEDACEEVGTDFELHLIDDFNRTGTWTLIGHPVVEPLRCCRFDGGIHHSGTAGADDGRAS